MITIKMPTNITDSTLTFLEQAQLIFEHDGKRTPGAILRYDKVRKMSLFSQLLLYKFINYTATNACFTDPKFITNEYVDSELKKSGFSKLIKYHMRDPEKSGKKSFFKSLFSSDNDDNLDVEPLDSLVTLFKNNIYIAPLILKRSDQHRLQLETDFIKRIKSVYKNNTVIIDIVTKCLTEIYMNFWEHATEDSGTVMVAKGDNKLFELMFADNGNGIISTLKSAGYSGNHELLSLSIKRGITSKPKTNHMGWGLWMVAKLCEINMGELEIFSEGKYLSIKNGKTSHKNCGYWKGTIIHLKIPFESPKSLSSLNWQHDNSIKINWG